MAWEGGRRFKTEGTYVYLWLIHGDVWQKPTQYYKVIILQLKINLKKETRTPEVTSPSSSTKDLFAI